MSPKYKLHLKAAGESVELFLPLLLHVKDCNLSNFDRRKIVMDRRFKRVSPNLHDS